MMFLMLAGIWEIQICKRCTLLLLVVLTPTTISNGESKLVAWFVNGRDLERLRREAVRKGVPLGEVKSGSRRRPDGVQLSWQFTDPWAPVAEGIVPFFINWGDSPHPARTAAKGGTLISLRAEHPDVRGVRRMLRGLGLDLQVKLGQSPALIAVIEGREALWSCGSQSVDSIPQQTAITRSLCLRARR